MYISNHHRNLIGSYKNLNSYDGPHETVYDIYKPVHFKSIEHIEPDIDYSDHTFGFKHFD